MRIHPTLRLPLAAIATGAIALTATPAVAERGPTAPAFEQPTRVRGDVDRSMAISDGTTPMLPFDVVHFDLDSAELDDVDRVQVRGAIDYLAAHPSYHLLIEAHTDTSGSAAYNEQLSAARARAVRDELLAAGARDDQLILRAWGERDAIAGAPAASRRVVIHAVPNVIVR